MASYLYAALLLCLVPQGILAEYYGRFIGDIKTQAHDFKGKVYAVSDNQVYIAEMTYDGRGPAAYFWVGKGEKPDNHGSAVPDEDNSTRVLQRYDNSLVLLRLPKRITEYDYLGIYCKKYEVNFGHVIFRNVEIPMEQSLGAMATKKNGVKANEVTLKDSATIELRDFEYDGQGGDDVYFAVGANRDDSKDNLTKLADESGRNSRLGAYQPARTITLRLPEGHHWNEYKWFTVYNFDGSGESYGDVYVDTSVAEKLPVHAPMSKVSKRNGILAEYYGRFIGDIKTQAHDFKGKVYAVSDNQVYIAEMTYDGRGPAAYFWVGKGEKPDNHGSAVPDEDNSTRVLQRYDNSLVLLRLPKRITEYDYLGIYCKKYEVNFGHVIFRNVEIPMEQSLGAMATKKNGVKANEVTLKDSATIELRDFEYDGQGGDDVYFAVGANRDDSKDNLTKLADESGRNSRLGAYQPARTITLRLPEGHHWNEYKWFTVYNFDGSGESYGDVYVDTSVAEKLPVHAPMSKVSKRNGILAEYYGRFIGDIKTQAHDFKGKVYAVSDNQVYIAEMTYDGRGPAAYFWVGKGEKPDNHGSAVPDEDNSTRVLQRYDNSLVLLRLPKRITEYDYLGIYCKKYEVNFGHVMFRNVELPMEQRLGAMATKKNGVKANEVTLKDSATIELRDFEYDGQGGDDVYFAVGANRDDTKDRLTKLADENGRNSRLGAYQPARTITLRLPEGHHWNEYKWFTVYNFDGSGESYGDVYVDTSVAEKLPVHAPMSKVSKRNGILAEYYGRFIGDIKTQAHDFKGKVYAVSDNQVYIAEMTYDGRGPAAYFWVGKGEKPDNHGSAVPDEDNSTRVLQRYDNSLVLLRLPKRITEYDYLGIYCKKYEVNFGHVIFRNVELPMEQSLGAMATKKNGVKANEVTLKDSATIELRDFEYDGQGGDDVYFAVGANRDDSKDNLTKLADESGRNSRLGAYQPARTITLRLPEGHHWNEYKWFTVYNFDGSGESYGDVYVDTSVAEKLPVHAPMSKVSKRNVQGGGAGMSPVTVMSLLGLTCLVSFVSRWHC